MQKHIILRGAFFLTLAGIIGRIIGFFYRIFLSRIIGAEGVGIYQLVFPLYALTYSLTVSGIQTTISRFVSAKTASGDKKGALRILQTGLFLSLALSLVTAFLLLRFHRILAVSFIKEERCSRLLKLLAFSVPFGSVHACIDGYYYGRKCTSIPAVGQILEHTLRFLSVFLLYQIWLEKGIPVTPAIAVFGIIIEELIAALFSVTVLTIHLSRYPVKQSALYSRIVYLRERITFSAPLTLNRVLVNLLQSMEAFLIPLQLRLFGMNSSEALSLYGILTGMALPLILFPTALTSSISTMLLPIVSEAQATKDRKQILSAIRKACSGCLLLGVFCWFSFLCFGDFAGNVLFHSRTAGSFITCLAWICPLLYLNPALFAVLNGLGKTGNVLIHNLTGILIRILFILAAVPKIGILGYFQGLAAAQAVISALSLITLFKTVSSSVVQTK